MMSDDSFEDSFESGSGSDQEVEPAPTAREIRVLQTVGTGSSPRPVSMFSGNILPPSLYSKRDQNLAARGREADYTDDLRCS